MHTHTRNPFTNRNLCFWPQSASEIATPLQICNPCLTLTLHERPLRFFLPQHFPGLNMKKYSSIFFSSQSSFIYNKIQRQSSKATNPFPNQTFQPKSVFCEKRHPGFLRHKPNFGSANDSFCARLFFSFLFPSRNFRPH